MKNNDRIHWIRKDCIVHYDPISRNQLTISVESGLNIKNGWDNFSTTRLTFIIKDSRTQGINRIKIELEYPHVVSLVDFLNKQPSWNKAFDIGAKTEVTKHYLKNKKTLIVAFVVMDRKKMFQVKIVDRTSQIVQSEVKIDSIVFKGIYRYLNSYIDNFSIIESNFITSLSNKKLQEELFGHIDSKVDSLESRFKSLNASITEVLNESTNKLDRGNWQNSHQLPSRQFEYNDNDEFQIEDRNEEKKENIDLDSNPNNMSDEFSEFMVNNNNFEDMDIGVEVKQSKKTEKKVNLVNELPFTVRVLNKDIEFLSSWSSSFLFITEDSDKDLFAPYDHILKTVSIGPELHNHLKSIDGYYAFQYLVHRLMRDINRSYILGSSYDVPILMFPEPFCSDEKFKSISHEIITLYLIYSYATKRILGNIDNIDKQIEQKFESTLLYLKVLLSPFIFSCKLDKSEILYRYKLINSDESLSENLNIELSKATLGGNVSINYKTFEHYVDSFVEFVSDNISNTDSNNKYVLSDKDLFDRVSTDYKIQINPNKIQSVEDIKTEMFSFNEENNELNEEVVNNTENDEEGQNDSNKFNLFIKTIGNHLDNDTLQETTFSGVFLNHDVPIDAYVAKRVMDIDSSLKTVSDVKKAMKYITESENITIKRVMGEIGNNTDDNVNDADIDSIMDVLENV